MCVHPRPGCAQRRDDDNNDNTRVKAQQFCIFIIINNLRGTSHPRTAPRRFSRARRLTHVR